MEKNHFTNRLSKEKSSYLLQHAHNPVDWYPWGEEAFEAAKQRDVPIFLSIGYSTCHWCHVMERETFEDFEAAMALNDAFVCIKVDREEMPDIDSLYMEFAQTMIVGAAGWPLNLLLTPDLKPFFASTYLPLHSTHTSVGVIELTHKIRELWRGESRQRLVSQAEKIVEILQHHVHMKGLELPLREIIQESEEVLYKIADPVYGGMRGAPKFPLGYQNNFLMDRYLTTQDARSLYLAEKALEMMQRGGIHDHLGGGFSRYSVDERWQIPHFEKMLYDNALLARAYLQVWRITRRALYKEILDHLFEYVHRDMTHPEGGFYTAEDAEIDETEGLFYTWTRQEIITLLGEATGTLIADYYGVSDEGNFEGRSVLVIEQPDTEFAKQHGIDEEAWVLMLQEAKGKLFEERKKRKHPFKDTKIVVSWNGLMIRALAEAGHYLPSNAYVERAVSAARFIKRNLWKDHKLKRCYYDNEARHSATLDDYSFLLSGIISLFEATGDSEWLTWALDLAACLESDFKELDGAFFQSDGNDPYLLVRKCQFSDGAEPSGNAVHAENLLRLHQITTDYNYIVQAEDIFRAVKRFADTYPLGYIYHLIALMRYYDDKKALLITASNERDEHVADITKLESSHAILHHICTTKKGDELAKVVPIFEDKSPQKGQTTLYICYEGACRQPHNNMAAIEEALRKL